MRRIALFAIALTSIALVSILLLAAGCGGGGGDGSGGDDSAGSPGAKIFAEQGCGNCHTMRAANAKGQVGPDLDELRPNEETVARQVTNGGNGMPAFKDKLTAEEIQQVAGFVATAAGSGTAGKISFEPDDKKVEDCAQDAACLEQAFGNLAYEEGPKAALDKLAEMQSTNPVIAGSCHPIAHKIGAGGLLHYEGSVGKAFAAGNATCGAGFYHGLLQWKLAGVSADRVGSVARTACNEPEIKVNAFNYYQCDHGLGHGLMLYTAYDLPKALDYCHQLQTEFDQVSCSGGVFMENQSSSFGLRTKWLSKKNLLYPCNSKLVERRDKLYCYLLVTSHILPNVNGDWKKTADWCRKSERGWAEICFQSYGRDVAGNAGRDPQGMKSLCAQAGSGERDCIYGAIRDVMNNNPQDPNGKAFCESVSPGFRPYCFFGMGTILGTQQSTPEAKRQACEQWAKGGDLTECLKGAGV
ncbi:MAG TPA: cytochrome c [Gaiellaceae bacterium]|nr:cytochrome c [Gaiellaceae bacterium]